MSIKKQGWPSLRIGGNMSQLILNRILGVCSRNLLSMELALKTEKDILDREEEVTSRIASKSSKELPGPT